MGNDWNLIHYSPLFLSYSLPSAFSDDMWQLIFQKAQSLMGPIRFTNIIKRSWFISATLALLFEINLHIGMTLRECCLQI